MWQKGEFKGEFKGKEGEKGKQGPKGPTLSPPKASGSKCARISEEPPEIVEANSNKIPDNGAMTDGSKRRHEAVESNSDAESASSLMGSYSFHHYFQRCSQGCQQPTSEMQTGRMPPSTMRRSISMCHSLHGSRIHITGHARFSRWAVLPKKPITYHDFVVRVFNQNMEECRYAKKMIGQFRKKLTPTPRTQGPDFCAFLIHCRVDAFLNAGYVYQREFSWR